MPANSTAATTTKIRKNNFGKKESHRWDLHFSNSCLKSKRDPNKLLTHTYHKYTRYNNMATGKIDLEKPQIVELSAKYVHTLSCTNVYALWQLRNKRCFFPLSFFPLSLHSCVNHDGPILYSVQLQLVPSIHNVVGLDLSLQCAAL